MVWDLSCIVLVLLIFFISVLNIWYYLIMKSLSADQKDELIAEINADPHLFW